MHRSSDLVDYYYLYKELILQHQKLKFGKAPRSSEGFTEAICAHLFKFKKANNVKREYDLYDHLNNLKIEVKGTTETYGSTTINSKALFDRLYWVTFLLPQDSMVIRYIPYEEVKKFLQSKSNENRTNITLSNYKSFEPTYFFFCKNRKDIVPQTLTEHLEHIKLYLK